MSGRAHPRALPLVLALLLGLVPAGRGQDADPGPGAAADAPPAAAVAPDEALRRAAFDPALLRDRRRRLIESLPEKAVVVVAAAPRGHDDNALYRPAPDMLYLSGQRQAGLALLLTRESDLLLAPARSRLWESWNGPRVAPGSPLAAASGFDHVREHAELGRRVAAAAAAGGTIYLSGIEPAELGLPATARVQPLAPAIDALRQVKDPAEVALLEQACRVTAAALNEAIRSIEPGLHEYEVRAAIEYVFLRYGAERAGFASIVGSGPNSCVLHYTANRRRIEAGDLVVMDVGAELWGYTADITRTVPASGRFTARQRRVYEVVLAAQQAGIAAIRPGATLADVDRAARAVVEREGFGRAFLHFTSHWLGLDVHDVGRGDRPFEPGMVLTVEPGIYLADEALGVRIEDDVLVTADGHRVLSAGVPRTPDELEALMTGRGVGNAPVAPLPSAPAGGGAPPEREGSGRPRYFVTPPERNER